MPRKIETQTESATAISLSVDCVEKCFQDFEREFNGKSPEEVGEEVFTKYMTERTLYYLKKNMTVISDGGNA